MRSLYEIAVTVRGPDDIDDPLHCEITVEPALATALAQVGPTEADMDEALVPFGSPDDAALREAGRHHAGVLGRIATALTPWLEYTRKEHRCAQGGPLLMWEDREPNWWESCHIRGDGVLAPGRSDYSQPALWIIVPATERSAWLDRIREALELVVADAE